MIHSGGGDDASCAVCDVISRMKSGRGNSPELRKKNVRNPVIAPFFVSYSQCLSKKIRRF